MITPPSQSLYSESSSRTLFGSTVESNLFAGAVFFVLSLLGLELMINLELIRKSRIKTDDLKIKTDRTIQYDSELESSKLWWNRKKFPSYYHVKISYWLSQSLLSKWVLDWSPNFSNWNESLNLRIQSEELNFRLQLLPDRGPSGDVGRRWRARGTPTGWPQRREYCQDDCCGCISIS